MDWTKKRNIQEKQPKLTREAYMKQEAKTIDSLQKKKKKENSYQLNRIEKFKNRYARRSRMELLNIKRINKGMMEKTLRNKRGKKKPVIKRLDPRSTLRFKFSTSTLPDGVTT